jgi:DnaJ-class molecular chaperone
MRERGVENAQRPEQRGDQIVTIEVVVPHLQDERSKEIMRELAKLNSRIRGWRCLKRAGNREQGTGAEMSTYLGGRLR